MKLTTTLQFPAVRRSLMYFVQFFQVFLASKLGFQCSVLILLSGYFIGMIDPMFEGFVFVPINLFHLHIWKPITCIIIETNIIVIIWNIYCIHLFLTFISPNWSLIEIVRYTLIVHFAASLLIVILSLLLLIFFKYWDIFYSTQIYGIATLSIAFLVSLKQFLPDTVVLTTPLGRMKNWHLPIASFVTAIFLWLFGLIRGTIPVQIIFGLQISWSYLRFIQPHPENDNILGDDSEHFTWASLFPMRVQPFATVVGKLTFRSLRRLGLCKQRLVEMESLELESVIDSSVFLESRDAERKRQKALRMLNERLSALSPPNPPQLKTDGEDQNQPSA